TTEVDDLGDILEDFNRQRIGANEEVWTEDGGAKEPLSALDGLLAGTPVLRGATPLHARLHKCMSGWDSFMANPDKFLDGKAPLDVLQLRKQAAINEIRAIANDAQKLQGAQGKVELEALKAEGLKAQREADDKARPARIEAD